MSVPSKQLAETQAKLATLLTEIRGTPLQERVNAWINRMAGGKKLSQYLDDAGVPLADKLTVARNLVDILLAKDYTRLPEMTPAPVTPNPIVVTVPDDSSVIRPADDVPVPARITGLGHGTVAVTPDEPADDLPEIPGVTPAVRDYIRREVRRELGVALAAIARVLAQA